MSEAPGSLEQRLERLYNESTPEEQVIFMNIFTRAAGASGDDVEGYGSLLDGVTTFNHTDKMTNDTMNTISRVLRALGEMRQEGAAKRGGL